MDQQPMTRREKWAQGDAERAAIKDRNGWGMNHAPDTWDVFAFARAAYERGDRWFRADVPISHVQGSAAMGQTSTWTQHRDDGDIIGQIEDLGWRLEHVAATYVTRGHASTKRLQVAVVTSADDVAYHGELVALYVFRRA